MIAVRLMGGLGNQMFQYAAARRLALKRHTKVLMDMEFFDNIADVDTLREYELDCFNIKASVLPPPRRPFPDQNERYKTKGGKLARLKHQLQRRNWYTHSESDHTFDNTVLSLPNQSYLNGYWQSEKYFSDIRDALLKDFSFKKRPSGNNKKLLDQITRDDSSVSLHVRRGDYVANIHANKYHGTKGNDYYQAAVKVISRIIKQPNIYVFSDDPGWCKKNLKFKYPTTYVEGNEKGFEDMRLMSACRHNIIANSSFSWWAAWLNTNPEKVVVAPKQWFNDPSVNTKDVIPKSWIRV